MADLHAFFDRDVFLKLACCDLWDDVLEALGVTHPYRLASATASGSKNILRKWGIDDILLEATTARIRAMVEQASVVPKAWAKAAINAEFYKNMIATNGVAIDDGEAMLAVAALSCKHDNKLVTGDKNFIKAMKANFPTEFAKLLPALVSFERCLLAVCELRGFENVKGRLFTARLCDKTLGLALGSDGLATYESFSKVLRDYDPLKGTRD